MLNLQAPRILLMGPPGSGKTDVLATLAESSLELFVIVTEPGGVDSLLDSFNRRKLEINRLHWKEINPSSAGHAGLADMARTIKAMSYKDIADIKSGVSKQNMKGIETLLSTLQNFHCDRENKDFGDVTEWGDDRALVLDSLSGLNMMAMSHTIGYKPSAHQGEWGIAMNFEEQLINTLISDCRCTFVLTAHVDRDLDTVTGQIKLAPAALGSKLGPRIPRFFGDVIYASRDGTGFKWSTAESNIDLKNRALPVSSKLEPNFKPIIDVYRRRKQQLASPQPAVATPPVA